MELDEVVGRVLRPHLRLIVACMLLGLLAAWSLHMDDQQEFQASVRLVLNSPDPVNTSQASVLADTARGIASGPSLIRKALKEVGVRRDPADFGDHDVDVRPLGSSGILRLVVSDREPRVAVDMANAIAESVIAARGRLTEGQAVGAIDSLESEIATADKQLTALDEQIQGLREQTTLSPNDARKLQDAESERDSVTRQLGQLQSELASINSERALRPQAGIIDAATVALPLPNRKIPDYLLGGLLGLAAGIALAAIRETASPTVVGQAALARAFTAPILAHLPAPPDRCGAGDVAVAAHYVELSAVAAGVGRVQVMTLGPSVAIGRFLRFIEEDLTSVVVHRVDPLERPGNGPERPVLVPATRDQRQRGLVVLVPEVVRLSALDPARNLLAITGWPLLGVVVFRRPGRHLPLMFSKSRTAALPPVEAPLPKQAGAPTTTKGAGA